MSRKYHTKIYWLLVHYSGQVQYSVIWWVNYSAGLKCPQASTMTRTRTRLGTSTIHVVGLWPQASLWCPPHPTPLRTKTNLTLTLFAADIRGGFQILFGRLSPPKGYPPPSRIIFWPKRIGGLPSPLISGQISPTRAKNKRLRYFHNFSTKNSKLHFVAPSICSRETKHYHFRIVNF